MRLLPAGLVLASVVATVPSAASATVIHVLPDGSGDVATIADALAVAVFGDIIALGDGVFYEHDLPLKSGVSIASDSGDPARTLVDAQLAGRCLSGPSVTGAPSIRGITFMNGIHATEGGLLLAGHNNIRFYDCVFRNGSAPKGGAVSLPDPSYGHAPQFFRCRFESNQAVDGGAIWSAGVGYVEDGQFAGNIAQGSGGAVYCRKDSGWGIWLRTCRFEENGAGVDGGAVHSSGGGFPYGTSITGCDFVGNTALLGGAALLDGFDYAVASRFLDNEAGDAGGALYLIDIRVDKDFDYFTGNLLAGNRAVSRGGAIVVTGSGCFLTLHNSTLSGNEAPAGAHFWSGSTGTWGELSHTIIAFGRLGAAAAGGGTVSAGCSDVYRNAGGDYTGPLAGQGSVNGNLSRDPLFCNPGADDYSLALGSPCFTPLPAGCSTGAIGAYGIGCSSTSSVPGGSASDIGFTSWGRLKADHRR